MTKAIFQGAVIAESDETIIVEGNHYFPPSSVNDAFLEASEARSTCPWKGLAHYYHVSVNGRVGKNAAWTYPQPSDAASHIQDYIAFWGDVTVTES